MYMYDMINTVFIISMSWEGKCRVEWKFYFYSIFEHVLKLHVHIMHVHYNPFMCILNDGVVCVHVG